MLRLFVYVAAEGEVRQKIAEPDYGKASEQAANAFNTNRQDVGQLPMNNNRQLVSSERTL